jgi:ubiquitin-conjugating enzyme E2 S
VIDGEFPSKPPKGFFLTKIFHPNVAQPSGDICVNTLKRDWNPASWSLSHIFQIIRCLLIVPFPESALNEEAGRLFMESYEEYFSQAKLLAGIHAKPNAQQHFLMKQHYSE